MCEIIYRTLQKGDYDDIKELIDDAWHFDKYSDTPKTKKHILNAFMKGAMINQNYNQVAVKDGKVIGLLFGKIPQNKGFLKNIKYIPSAIYHSLHLNFGKFRRKMAKGFMNLQKVYIELLKETKIDFQAELEFFIVHSKAQGHGIGKKLLLDYEEYCKKSGVKNMYVYTDVNCNFGFYDYNGFIRQGSKPVTFELVTGDFTFDVYIYSKELS